MLYFFATSDGPREGITKRDDPATERPSSPFDEFFHLFAAMSNAQELFPKVCKTCSKEYDSIDQYFCLTRPKGHVFEDCSRVMKRPFTMIYRHCSCGNTLVLTLTAENFPELERFWCRLAQEAEESGRPLMDVVDQFAKEYDRYILHQENHRQERIEGPRPL